MTTSPRHMTLANARIAHNTSTAAAAEITKFVRQHYQPQPAPPYKYRKICQKTSCTMLHERPESTWQNNYERRSHNMTCGYYSQPNEPYRDVGGKFELDPYDLVLSTMGDHLHPKAWDHPRSRDGTVKFRPSPPAKKRRQSNLPPIPTNVLSKQGHDSQCAVTEDQESDGGMSSIRSQLNDLGTAKMRVRGGKSFEEFIKHLQDLKANKIKPTNDNDMVLLPIELYTDNQGNDQPTDQPTDSSPDLLDMISSNIVKMDGPSANSSNTSGMPSLRNITGHYESRGGSSGIANNRKMSVYLRSVTSLFPVIDMDSAASERKERIKRIHMEYLEALNVIINTLYNMKTRDLKSKTPLALDHLKQLRKDTVHLPTFVGDGRESAQTWRTAKPLKNASVVSVKESKASTVGFGTGGFASLFASKKKGTNMFEQVAMIPSKLGHSRRINERQMKQKTDELNLESWEDFLAVDPNVPRPKHPKRKSFATGVQILVKAVQWHKRLSTATVHSDIIAAMFKGNQGSGTATPESQDSSLKVENIAKSMYSTESGKKPPVKKTPIWLKIAAEKPELYEEKKSDKKEHVDVENIVDQMRSKFSHLKHKHQQETDAEVQKLERERLLTFRYKYCLFDYMSCNFDEHVLLLSHARNNINQNIDISEVEPSLWYEALKEKAITICGSGDDVDSILLKIGRHFTMDGKSVHLGKAKLCLIVMSLPAYEICTVAYQTAIKFVLETIMLLDLRNLTDWLELRKVPYNVYDTEDTVEDIQDEQN